MCVRVISARIFNGSMSGISPQQAAKVVAAYKVAVMDEIEKRCKSYCDELCRRAIENRQEAPGKHNFTGNLITSIVTCVYREHKPVYACYAGDSLPTPIQVKMTAPRRYHFDYDYQGDSSNYKATVKTNEGWGQDDAVEFFQSYRPDGKHIFDIVVAYPVEYAQFIEDERHTTGILQTYADAKRLGVTYLCIRNN